MKIRFIGPLGTVTGSCTWLEYEGTEFLVDCGLEQDNKSGDGWSEGELPFDPARLRFVILTHAHADHCGLIPLLYKQGFRGIVYCTPETAKIASLMLNDAARLSGGLYGSSEVDAIRWHGIDSPTLGRIFPVAHNLFVTFYRAAHVMGAVSVRIMWGDRNGGTQKSIMFSGDLGPDREDLEELPFLRFRFDVPPCDFAVIESTYGSRTRDPEERRLRNRISRLRELVERINAAGSTLLIPAFSLGRVQDILFDIHWLFAEHPGAYDHISVFLDAPLADRLAPELADGLERTEHNRKGKVRPVWLGKQLFRWLGLDEAEPSDFDRAIDVCRMTLGLPVKYPDASTRGNDIAKAWPRLLGAGRSGADPCKGPRIVIATSGMGDHGRSAAWLQTLLTDPDAIVAFSGYCSSSSVGGKLLDLSGIAASERRRLRGAISWPDGHSIAERDIQAFITSLTGYSGHADSAGLVDWIFSEFRGQLQVAGSTVFIQHGNEQDRVALAQALEERARSLNVSLRCVRPMPGDGILRLDEMQH
jgi:metallo-beta-lactamase family protein